LEPLKLHHRLEEIKKQETDDNTNIYFTGYPALYGYIYALSPHMYAVFGLTILVIVGLLFYYFRVWQGVVFPVLSAGVSAVWGLGFASLLNFSLDPLILVVPLIITARAISHSVQCMARYHEEYLVRNDQKEAIVKGYSELFMPASLSIVTDAIGILMISVATIPLMRNLGFFASFWILTIVVSVPTLSPIMLSFVKPPNRDRLEKESRGKIYDAIAKFLLIPTRGRARWVVLGIVVFIFVVGGHYAMKLKVGDTEAGAAILFPDHDYNRAFKFFNTNFVGATQMVIIAEGKETGALKDAKSLQMMEDFQRYMEAEGGAAGSLTFSNTIKRINRMFHEGHPKWEKLPKLKKSLGEIGFIVETNSAAGEMDRWISRDWSNGTITCFYKGYNNDTITQTIDKAKEFIGSHPSDKINFRLAGGMMGILAAVNEEVEYSYWVSLGVVFLAVFILCILSFRSLKAAIILITPLAIAQILSEVFMYARGIDLNINSLPVAAIAVGIGIDYGIYLMARIAEEFKIHGKYSIANSRALETTGKAIIFTATTLIAGVVFWAFVDVKFQAEMGMLLGLLMFLNMTTALILIPSLVSLLKPKFVSQKA
ncbi:MAG: MMPL family transporter, partial [Desulfobacterales bacterium]